MVPRHMLSNTQKSAGAHTSNPFGWRCKKHDKTPTGLDVRPQREESVNFGA